MNKKWQTLICLSAMVVAGKLSGWVGVAISFLASLPMFQMAFDADELK